MWHGIGGLPRLATQAIRESGSDISRAFANVVSATRLSKAFNILPFMDNCWFIGRDCSSNSHLGRRQGGSETRIRVRQ